MKYMLMMHAPRGTGDWGAAQWSPEALQAHLEFMHRLNKDLKEAGELVAAEGLATPGEARIVRATKGGAPAVTDGPFRRRGSWPATGSWTRTRRSARTRSPRARRRRRAPTARRSTSRSRSAR